MARSFVSPSLALARQSSHFSPRLRGAVLWIGVALLSASAVCTHAFAQFFVPVGGPEGGWISSITRDATSGNLYAGLSYQWGYNKTAGSLWKSIDSGASWALLPSAITGVFEQNTTAPRVAITPSSTVFVGMRGAGVRRSDDGGASFVTVNAGLPAGFMVVDIALGVDQTLYAAIQNSGVYQLPSGGSTWSPSNTGLPTLVVRSVAVINQVQFVGTSTGLYRRTAGGSWMPPVVGVGAIGVGAFSQGPGGIYACCENGLWRSVDGGNQWAQLSGPFSGVQTYSACDTGSALIVGSQAGFHRSLNGGAWTAAAGIASGAIARCFVSEAGLLMTGTFEVGILASSDSGATWESRNTGLAGHTVLRMTVTTSGTILAGTNNGMYRRSGGVWEAPDLLARRIFALAQAPWGQVYAGNYNITAGVSDGHAFVSNDDGQTWSDVSWGASPAMVSGFAFVPTTQEVFASVAWNSGGVLKRALNQSTWSAVGPADNPPAYFMGRSAAGDLYIGSEGLGVRRLAAGAPQSAWTNLGFSSSQQFAIAFNAAGNVFFGNDGNIRGIYRSIDGGQTFQPLDGYPSLYGHAIVIASDGTIFCASRDKGVWRSTDNGVTWQDVSAGLSSTSVLSLAIGPDGYLYAGSAGHGVYRSAAPVVHLCVADIDRSGAVDGLDLSIMLSSWGAAGSNSADLNSDGLVDGLDLSIMLSSWGGCNG